MSALAPRGRGREQSSEEDPYGQHYGCGRCSCRNLIRLAYLGVTNVFALLRLLPVSRLDEDAEILALRHQFLALQRQLGFLALQRQLGPDRARFTPADRVLLTLAALLHQHVA